MVWLGDAFFGDNHSFNETLFQEVNNYFWFSSKFKNSQIFFIQFSDFSNRFGAGNYNETVAGEFRFQRIQDSIATNPEFSFVSPRYFTAYAESVFPFLFFVDGRVSDGQLNLTVARGFFQNSSMPDGFFRANQSIGLDEIGAPLASVFKAHPIQPGKNQGGVNNYVLDPTSASFSNDGCLLYSNFVNQTVRSLYPNPTGALRDALNFNLDNFYGPMKDSGCPQIFPFGKWGIRSSNSSVSSVCFSPFKDISWSWTILLLLYMTSIILTSDLDKFVGRPPRRRI